MISSIPSNYANTIAPFAPVGRAPVSQESEDLKSSSFRPTEQLAESARALNRRFPDERPNDDVERDRLERGAREAAAKTANGDEQLKTEQEQTQELAARDREVRAHEQAHSAVYDTERTAQLFCAVLNRWRQFAEKDLEAAHED